MKPQLLDRTAVLLLKHGYIAKVVEHSCFELVARKEDQVLLLKFLEDVNSVSEEFVAQMCNVAAYVNAVPVIISEKAGRKLQDRVVYNRLGIITLNISTFKDCIENNFPVLQSTHAGVTATLSGDRLRKAMENKGVTITRLSRRIGVSKRMIAEYERGSAVTVAKAEKLYQALGATVFERINPFAIKTGDFGEAKTKVAKKYEALGFKAADTKKVPFDVIAKKDNEVIFTEVGDKIKKELEGIARLLEADKLVIYDRKRPKDLPALSRQKFMELENAEEVVKVVKES